MLGSCYVYGFVCSAGGVQMRMQTFFSVFLCVFNKLWLVFKCMQILKNTTGNKRGGGGGGGGSNADASL